MRRPFPERFRKAPRGRGDGLIVVAAEQRRAPLGRRLGQEEMAFRETPDGPADVLAGDAVAVMWP
jgi:hypothetical protein